MAEPCFAWTAGTHASSFMDAPRGGNVRIILHLSTCCKLAWMLAFASMTDGRLRIRDNLIPALSPSPIVPAALPDRGTQQLSV